MVPAGAGSVYSGGGRSLQRPLPVKRAIFQTPFWPSGVCAKLYTCKPRVGRLTLFSFYRVSWDAEIANALSVCLSVCLNVCLNVRPPVRLFNSWTTSKLFSTVTYGFENLSLPRTV